MSKNIEYNYNLISKPFNIYLNRGLVEIGYTYVNRGLVEIGRKTSLGGFSGNRMPKGFSGNRMLGGFSGDWIYSKETFHAFLGGWQASLFFHAFLGRGGYTILSRLFKEGA